MKAVEPIQLSIFQDESPNTEMPLRRTSAAIPWSYSRRSTLEHCARRYYYEYYGANKSTAKQEPAKEALHLLKGLQNLSARTGYLLHLAIGTYLHKSQEGNVWSVDSLVNWTRSILRSDIEYSLTLSKGGKVSTKKYMPAFLHEYYYQWPNAAELSAEAETRLSQALHSFMTNTSYHQFHAAGSTHNAIIEQPFKLQIPHCRVDGQVDLAYKNEDGATIVDWKSGTEEKSGDDSLQLAAYALWATDYYGCAPEALHVLKVYLSSNEMVSFRADSQVLAAARMRIIQDAGRMDALHKYGQMAVADAFTPCAQLSLCRLCSFQEVCLQEKEALYARD